MRFAGSFSISYKSNRSDMWQPQFMSRCSHDMTVTRRYLYLCLAHIILFSLLPCDVHCSSFSRHRSKIFNAKKSVEDTTEAASAVPDQIALAANNNQRRKDHGYGNLEMNLVRPEKEPRLHAHISTKYTTSIVADHTPASSLEEAETAEEYVSKAMQRFGSRLKEPIRIEPEPELENSATYNDGTGNYYERFSSTERSSQEGDPYEQSEFVSQQPQNQQEENRSELDIQTRAQYPEQQQQQQDSEQGQEDPFKYYQTQDGGVIGDQQIAEGVVEQPAPVYEKNHQGASYRLYEDAQPNDRTYRTKYVYQPNYRNPESESNSNSDKIRVSASTEIPKAEIMKQIEKSVIKYMQELEAEGKIITAPKVPKTYYKVVTVPVEEKYTPTITTITTTMRPKYLSSEDAAWLHGSHDRGTPSAEPYGIEKPTRYHTSKSHYKHQNPSDNSAFYQPAAHTQQQHETSDSLGPNVEFVYKIKSRAPLQTATVKTISRPYSLPSKSAPDQFDHSAVLKNMEEFDLRHVVTTKDIEEQAPSTSRPSKLYFNSEVHQDINSLPHKGDKSRLPATEYRKLKETPLPGDYKGYSGYFAEPASVQAEKEVYASNSNADDGYPVMNPYPYVLKKEHPQPQYEEVSKSGNWDQPRIHGKPIFSVTSSPKATEYDNYNLKYNNNPEDGYRYLQAYKPERDREPSHGIHKHVQRHVLGKRGKRGNHPSSTNKKSTLRNVKKDIGAGLALRPPPKV